MHRLSLPTTCLTWQVSVWNVVRELLTLSKQCVASRSSRLATTFVCGDLVYIPFFKGLHIDLCDQCLGPFPVLNKIGLALYKLEHHRACNVLVGCNCDMLYF
jgi:hypothetical protein